MLLVCMQVFPSCAVLLNCIVFHCMYLMCTLYKSCFNGWFQCRLRDITYSSPIVVDVEYMRQGKTIVNKVTIGRS